MRETQEYNRPDLTLTGIKQERAVGANIGHFTVNVVSLPCMTSTTTSQIQFIQKGYKIDQTKNSERQASL